MQFNQIRQLMEQLDGCFHADNLESAGTLLSRVWLHLQQAVYARVRGQAPPAVMRSLLELEIEIGGENGDFKAFNNREMTDLLHRGQVIHHLEKQMAPAAMLSAAVDAESMAHWLAGDNAAVLNMTSAQFIHAWLRLLAVESGILESDEQPHPSSTIADPLSESTLETEQPYVDPATGMAFVFVPGGKFSMGDTFGDGIDDEKPVHEVNLSSYHMAASPVTQAQWECLMTGNPSTFSGADHPVEQVQLSDVIMFIDKLNANAPQGMRFDLPSEAQWEYAARSGGLEQLYAGGQDPETVAWFDANSTEGTAPVCRKQPNDLGLYDMSGNVWEWCRDIYRAEAYRHHNPTDPVCTEGGKDRVIRGGSWNLDAWSARCSRRFRFAPDLYGPGLGFRLVMEGRR